MTQYYPTTELTIPYLILLMPCARLRSDKYKLYKSLVSLNRELNSRSATCDACVLLIRSPYPVSGQCDSAGYPTQHNIVVISVPVLTTRRDDRICRASPPRFRRSGYPSLVGSNSGRERYVAQAVEHSPVKVEIIHSSLHSGYICNLGYFPFRPVAHNWSIKDCGMCCSVCGKEPIKQPLLLIGKSSLSKEICHNDHMLGVQQPNGIKVNMLQRHN